MKSADSIPVLIDVDTGTDDALALMVACAAPNLHILGVTTVGGNVSLENTTINTLNVLSLLGRSDIQVSRGADKPLERNLTKASAIHGLTGLRGYDFDEDVYDALVEQPAWDFMNDILQESERKVTIIALAPMTNIALLLKKYPQVKEKIDKIIFMGTSYHDGNPTPVATFNVLADPEAFRAVLFSGIDLYALPLETGRKAILTWDEVKEIGGIEHEAAHFAYGLITAGGPAQEELDALAGVEGEEDISDYRMKRPVSEPAILDAATVAFAVHPEFFSFEKYYCDVECRGELTTGFTLIDMADYYQKTSQERNLYYIQSVDRHAYARLFLESVAFYGK